MFNILLKYLVMVMMKLFFILIYILLRWIITHVQCTIGHGLYSHKHCDKFPCCYPVELSTKLTPLSSMVRLIIKCCELELILFLQFAFLGNLLLRRVSFSHMLVLLVVLNASLSHVYIYLYTWR